VSDISRKGCCLETLYPLPVGTEVQLRLTVAGTVLDIAAKVAWIVPQSVMAMSFANISAEQESKIARIIEKVKTADSSPVAEPVLPAKLETANAQILRNAELLTKITERINEKGVLTKQELMDIVNPNQ